MGSSNLKITLTQDEPAEPLFARFRRQKVQKGAQEAFTQLKKKQESAPKFFFKTVPNSKDTLKGYQANSKIRSNTLFYMAVQILQKTEPQEVYLQVPRATSVAPALGVLLGFLGSNLRFRLVPWD